MEKKKGQLLIDEVLKIKLHAVSFIWQAFGKKIIEHLNFSLKWFFCI
jgi:hypothetical protein